MILLLGGTGYVGSAFAKELERRQIDHLNLSRRQVDYNRFEDLVTFLKSRRPEFLINCAGYTGKPNVDACETAKADTLAGNVALPLTIANACAALEIPWGHISSGCIYSGAKMVIDGCEQVEQDLTRPDLRTLVEQHPERVHGFTEVDPPNFSFRNEPCSFYSGSKALGEEVIQGGRQTYIWRLRIPFDEFDNPRNYLTKIQRYAKVYDNVNSITHRGDLARAALDLWQQRAPFGTYNITNPGFVTTRQVVRLMERYLKPGRAFEFWENDAEFYRVAAKTPRSNCVLDTTKLINVGVKIRGVVEALEDSLKGWQPLVTA